MAIKPIEGFYVHDEETGQDGVAKVSIDAVQDLVDDLNGAVEGWLDEHPEATTTVQDGVITTAKLANEAVTTAKIADKAVTLEKADPQKMDTYFFVDPQKSNADMTLIVTRNRKVAVIDVGTRAAFTDVLAPKLDVLGINHVDAFIVSHYHVDHVGGQGDGAVELIQSSYVDENTKIYLPHSTLDLTSFVTNQDVHAYKTKIVSAISALGYTPIYPTEEGETHSLDEFVTLSFYNVNSEWWAEYLEDTSNQYGVQTGTNVNYNNFSMCCMVANGNNHYFFSGDIYELAQSKIADELDYVNVYKVEHHGVNGVVNYKYLEKINPQIAVACISIDNFTERYNMPPSLAKFAETGEVYTTGDSGEIHVIDEYGGISATAEKGAANGYSLFSSGVRLSGAVDLNTVTKVANYECQISDVTSLSNSPVANDSFSLWVIPSKYFYKIQILVFRTSRKMFYREASIHYSTGAATWQDSWTEILTASSTVNDEELLFPSYIANSFVSAANFAESRVFATMSGKTLIISLNFNSNTDVAATSDFVPIGQFTGIKFSGDMYGTFSPQNGTSAPIVVRLKNDTGVISYYASGTTSGWYRGQIIARIKTRT